MELLHFRKTTRRFARPHPKRWCSIALFLGELAGCVTSDVERQVSLSAKTFSPEKQERIVAIAEGREVPSFGGYYLRRSARL